MIEFNDFIKNWIDNNAIFSIVTKYKDRKVKIGSIDLKLMDPTYDSGLVIILYDKPQKSEIIIMKETKNKITDITWYHISTKNLNFEDNHILDAFKTKPIDVYNYTDPDLLRYLEPSQIKIRSQSLTFVKKYLCCDNITIDVPLKSIYLPKDIYLLKNKNITLIYQGSRDYVDIHRLLHIFLDNNNKISAYINKELHICQTIKSKINLISI